MKLPVAPLPLQKIETIDEPRDRCYAQGLFYEEKKAHRDAFRNMLIWGYNKLVMVGLLEKVSGRIDLIHINHPHDVN